MSGLSVATAPARPRCSASSRARSRPSTAQSMLLPRARIGRLAQEAPDGPESLLEVVLAADTERTQLLAEAETATRSAPHRRDPDPARRHRRPFGARARRRDPRRPGLFPRRAAAPLRRILRRLAHAGCARGHAVRRARPAAARRADQLSRPRRHAVARGAHRALSAHGDRHQPRPRPARQRGRLDPAPRGRQAHALPRRLHRLRAPAPRAPGARPQARQDSRRRERKRLQAFVDRFRAKATKARQAQSRAQAAGQARADRGRRRRRSARRSSSRRPRRRCRRRSSRSTTSRSATSRASRCCGGSRCASTTTTASRSSAPTATANRRW